MAESNIPQNTPEFNWIVHCLRSRGDDFDVGELQNLSASGEIDWDGLIERSVKEQVSTLIYNITAGQDILPPETEGRLRQKYYYNARRNTILLDELGEILANLKDAGVPSLPLKGAALAEWAYGNPALRPMADLDLLVLPGDVEAINSVLTALDYLPSELEPWPGFNQRYRQVVEYHKRGANLPAYLLDLHYGPVDIPYYRRIPVEELFQRAQETIVANVVTLIPAAEDHLLILCAHLGLHERYLGTLMRYYDLYALIQQAGAKFDWALAQQRAVDWRLVIPLQRSLANLEVLWPGMVPENILREANEIIPATSERRLHRWVVDRTQNPTADVLLTTATLPGLSRKARYLLEQAFPSPDYMRKLYFRHHPQLWPLAYMLPRRANYPLSTPRPADSPYSIKT